MNPANGFELSDYMPTDYLMQIAWVDCLRWVMDEPGMMANFRRETGCNWQPAKNPLEKMIDQAAGSGLDAFKRLLVWFNETVWGDLNIVAGEHYADPA